LGIPAQSGLIAMPSFAQGLSDQQIAELANYVRTSWGNAAVANATSAMVATLRLAK
jgi:mono/diheme cytochrome c family protein